MAKNRFAEIGDKLESIARNASLKENISMIDKETKGKKTKNILIYNVPLEWQEVIKDNGFSFSNFAKVAIKEKLRSMGLE
jgi:hypothetical protein